MADKNNTNDLLTALLEVLAELRTRFHPTQFPDYMTTVQAAEYLGFSRQQLEIWRCYGGGPEYIKLAQAVRYHRKSLDEFMASRSKRHTGEA